MIDISLSLYLSIPFLLLVVYFLIPLYTILKIRQLDLPLNSL